MLNIGPQELLLILVIALLVVGPTRLPELGRSLGKGLREIRKAQDEVKRTISVNLDEPAGGAGAKPRTRPAAEATSGGAATASPPSLPAGAEGAAEGAAEAAVPPTAGPDPVPLAAEPPRPSEISEISRTLGRSLAELRRAREEVQRSFRVDLAGTSVPPPQAEPASGPSTPPPTVGPDAAPADETPPG